MFLALPDPDPLVRGTGSRSIIQKYGAGSESFPLLIEVLSIERTLAKIFFFFINLSKKFNFKTEDNVPAGKF
jgi:hypothetical protein